MTINCGQTYIPTTEETPLPCDEFKSTRCTIHEEALSYIGLPENSPLDTVLTNYLASLIDARNRIIILEAPSTKSISECVADNYTLVSTDAQNIVSVNYAGGTDVIVPVDSLLEFSTGTVITIVNSGTGVITIGGTGITFIQNLGFSIPQGGARNLVKLTTDTWIIKY